MWATGKSDPCPLESNFVPYLGEAGVEAVAIDLCILQNKSSIVEFIKGCMAISLLVNP